MRLIELTGMPGAGKSYILARHFSDPQYTRLDDSFLDRCLKLKFFPSFLRILVREIVCFFIGASLIGLKDLVICARVILDTNWNLYRKINVFRHIFKRHALLKFASRRPNEYYIIDEGLFHFRFVFSTSNKDCPETIYDYTRYCVPEIVIVVALENNIVERLARRGHDLILDTSNECCIREFVSANRKTLIALERYLKENSLPIRVIEN